MAHKDFVFNYVKDKDDILSSKFSKRAGLNNWKRIADTFYRASEVIFIQIGKDDEKLNYNQEMADQKKPVNWDYVPRLESLYCLQIGICIENMIKGLIIHNKPSLTQNGKLDRTLKTHNLKKLISFIPDYTLTEDETMLFEFLTIKVEWYSKYPIPLDAGDIVSSARYEAEGIRNIFLIIYNKLSRLMEATETLAWTYHRYEFSPDK